MKLLYIINKAEKYAFKSGSMVKAKQVTNARDYLWRLQIALLLSVTVLYISLVVKLISQLGF